MECAIATLMACFSWSNLFIDASVSMFDRGEPRQEWRVSEIRGDGVIETYGRFVTTDKTSNPYHGIAIGIDLPFRKVTLSADVAYRDSFDRDERVKSVNLRAHFYPFRR